MTCWSGPCRLNREAVRPCTRISHNRTRQLPTHATSPEPSEHQCLEHYRHSAAYSLKMGARAADCCEMLHRGQFYLRGDLGVISRPLRDRYPQEFHHLEHAQCPGADGTFTHVPSNTAAKPTNVPTSVLATAPRGDVKIHVANECADTTLYSSTPKSLTVENTIQTMAHRFQQ